jgi:hypothetical protein
VAKARIEISKMIQAEADILAATLCVNQLSVIQLFGSYACAPGN